MNPARLFALVAFVVPAAVLARPAFAAEPPAPPPVALRVMTYNILVALPAPGYQPWSKRQGGVKAALARYQPDLVGLQEPTAGQVRWLAEQFPDYEAVAPERFTDSTTLVRRERFEVVESGHVWLSATPEVPFSRGWGNFLPRIAQWVVLRERASKVEFCLANTHFDATQPFQPTCAPFFLRRMRALAAARPLIVTGDFNSSPASPAFRMLVGKQPLPVEEGAPPDAGPFLADSYDSAGEVRIEDLAGLREQYGFDVRIDHIFTMGAAFRTRRWIVDVRTWEGMRPSDHEPVIADLEFTPPGAPALPMPPAGPPARPAPPAEEEF